MGSLAPVLSKELTVGGHATEVLLQLGHVKGTVQGLGLHLVTGERGGGEVGVRSVETNRSDAAGYLRQSSKTPAQAHTHTCIELWSSCIPAA